MIERKFIVPSQSGWRTPLNIIMKPDKTIRITLDYKKLNNVTEKDAYPLPNISHLYLRLRNAKVFSEIDLASGYYQIRMDPKSQKYTAFGCEF